MIDHRAAIDHRRVAHPGPFVAPPFGAHHAGFLLRPADVEHALGRIELRQILLRNVVFALAFPETHDLHVTRVGKLVNARRKPIRLRRHARRRGKALPQVHAQIPHHATNPLQLRNIYVQVHPVDAFTVKHNVVPENFTYALWYRHFRLQSSTGLRTH